MDQTSMKNYAYNEGIEAGIKQNQIEIIKKMVKKKLNINTISDLTDIPVEEVNKLISSNL